MAVSSGAASGAISLNVGSSNTITIVVTAQDASTKTYSVTVTRAAAREINITGNSENIASGDTEPSLSDSTDFGNVNLTGGQNINTFVEKPGNADLHLIPQYIGTIAKSGSGSKETSANPISYAFVSIIGANSGDFSIYPVPVPAQNGISTTDHTIVNPGNSLSFQIVFDPTAEGLRTATISIANNDADEDPYTFAIQGTGISEPCLSRVINTWIGNTGNCNSSTENWSAERIPVLCDKVIIPAGKRVTLLSGNTGNV